MRLQPLIIALLAGALAGAEPGPWQAPDPVCCTPTFQRRLVVGTGDCPAPTVTAVVAPSSLLQATTRALDDRRLELHLRALGPGQGTLELRDAAGTVRLRRAVQVMRISTDSDRHIAAVGTRPDGSTLFGGQIIIAPYVPGLDVRFACLNGQVLVPDGLSERWIASETFTPNADGSSAQTSFRMLQAPGGRYVPFTYILYQDGEQISPP